MPSLSYDCVNMVSSFSSSSDADADTSLLQMHCFFELKIPTRRDVRLIDKNGKKKIRPGVSAGPEIYLHRLRLKVPDMYI